MYDFSNKTQNEASKLGICIDNNIIKQIDKQNLLGVFVDENLTWTAPIYHFCSTISCKVSLLKQLSLIVSLENHFYY